MERLDVLWGELVDEFEVLGINAYGGAGDSTYASIIFNLVDSNKSITVNLYEGEEEFEVFIEEKVPLNGYGDYDHITKQEERKKTIKEVINYVKKHSDNFKRLEKHYFF